MIKNSFLQFGRTSHLINSKNLNSHIKIERKK